MRRSYWEYESNEAYRKGEEDARWGRENSYEHDRYSDKEADRAYWDGVRDQERREQERREEREREEYEAQQAEYEARMRRLQKEEYIQQEIDDRERYYAEQYAQYMAEQQQQIEQNNDAENGEQDANP